MHGMMYAVPLVLCSAASRSSLTKPFPVLKDMHEMQHDLIEHFTAGEPPSSVPAVCVGGRMRVCMSKHSTQAHVSTLPARKVC